METEPVLAAVKARLQGSRRLEVPNTAEVEDPLEMLGCQEMVFDANLCA